MTDDEWPEPAPRDWQASLSAEQLAALRVDADWLDFRAGFRRQMVRDGHLASRWRSAFEADMILSLVALYWLDGKPLTLKELTGWFSAFTSEATLTRHLDDMEAEGTILRESDPADRRRILLVPTERLTEIGRIFYAGRVDILRRNGFVYSPETPPAE